MKGIGVLSDRSKKHQDCEDKWEEEVKCDV